MIETIKTSMQNFYQSISMLRKVFKQFLIAKGYLIALLAIVRILLLRFYKFDILWLDSVLPPLAASLFSIVILGFLISYDDETKRINIQEKVEEMSYGSIVNARNRIISNSGYNHKDNLNSSFFLENKDTFIEKIEDIENRGLTHKSISDLKNAVTLMRTVGEKIGTYIMFLGKEEVEIMHLLSNTPATPIIFGLEGILDPTKALKTVVKAEIKAGNAEHATLNAMKVMAKTYLTQLVKIIETIELKYGAKQEGKYLARQMSMSFNKQGDIVN